MEKLKFRRKLNTFSVIALCHSHDYSFNLRVYTRSLGQQFQKLTLKIADFYIGLINSPSRLRHALIHIFSSGLPCHPELSSPNGHLAPYI